MELSPATNKRKRREETEENAAEDMDNKKQLLYDGSTAAGNNPDNDQSPSPSADIEKKKTIKHVQFDDVTVFYFKRSQGFVGVPSQGTVTLGMARQHSHVEQLSVSDFLRRRRAQHKSILRERKLLPRRSTSVNNDTAFDDSSNDSDTPLPVDDYYFIQPISTKQRRSLLKQAGTNIDAAEKHELQLIRRSRMCCGCSCDNACLPETCECLLNGIACQVDRITFPCSCAQMHCNNPLGRLEFNQNRVRSHFIDTISRLEAEKVVMVEQATQHEVKECPSSLNLSSSATIDPDVVSLVTSILDTLDARSAIQEDIVVTSILLSLISSIDSTPAPLPSPPPNVVKKHFTRPRPGPFLPPAISLVPQQLRPRKVRSTRRSSTQAAIKSI